METSENKTTQQEQKDSSLSRPQMGAYETCEANCQQHGDYESRRMYMVSDWSQWSGCPQCEAIREKQEAEQEEKRRAEEKARSRQELIKSRFKAAAIPPRFAEHTFETYIGSTPEIAKKRESCMAYASNFPELSKSGTSIIMCGTTGTGKTHLSCAIANHIIKEHAMSAIFTTVMKAVRRVKDTYGGKGSEEEVIAAFNLPDLLILDEVGVQFGSDAEKLILFEILNERYQNMKPTILLSNLSPELLSEYIGERIMDRMKENGGKVLTFNWKSARK